MIQITAKDILILIVSAPLAIYFLFTMNHVQTYTSFSFSYLIYVNLIASAVLVIPLQYMISVSTASYETIEGISQNQLRGLYKMHFAIAVIIFCGYTYFINIIYIQYFISGYMLVSLFILFPCLYLIASGLGLYVNKIGRTRFKLLQGRDAKRMGIVQIVLGLGFTLLFLIIIPRLLEMIS